MGQKIHFIVNPAAGKPFPMLHTINELCNKYKVDWSIAITKKDNFDQLAKDAAQSDADIIAVYGGDGTLAHVAAELQGTDKAMGVLPGGTANVLSQELEIPGNIREACELICSGKHTTKAIDICQVCDKYFLLRVGIGFEAELIKGADRESKNKMGWLAYALSGLKATFKTKTTKYRLQLDGKSVECEGLSLIIANSGNLGLPGFKLFREINVSDGQMNVILIRSADLKLLQANDSDEQTDNFKLSLFQHWQAKDIIVEAGHKQSVQYDGEILEEEKLHFSIKPQALKVLTA